MGADYVQKERRFPKHGGFDELPTGAKCVSVDGDADRLVYFYRDASSNETRLLDGDIRARARWWRRASAI